MRNKVQFSKTWFLAVAACFMIAATAMAQPTDRVDAKQLWQLIDYVAVDYSGAVADGTIVSASEYAEMLDFTESAQKQVAQLPAHPARNDVAQAITTLHAAVVRKATAKEVARLAHRANTLLMILTS
ncbi:hypothetical protein DFR26_2225 [Paraperlucidibaca baekdonensis]|uniref:Uncharacterized protein n=1 Tax=Paraperlucidibaca baekdonensis TaxID=748120 RepID=A0A3E0GZL9_9GAMM|nr:hypothetical protein [Paraperlucidibaca baekdonensis]REH35601.1 hypothetical protein DFR26_2225 [Paraperlucidibaca baekdonensis]